MDVHSLPGRWIKAKKDLSFEMYSLFEIDKQPRLITIPKGKEYHVAIAISAAYGN